jgi:glycosyltransferase involved in cell wall biosynthesis
MHPFRVLQVITIMNRGGAETMIMNYYRAMDRSKIQFDFLVHRTEMGAYDDEIKVLGGNIYHMPALVPKNLQQYISALETFFKGHQEYKIIHSHLNAYSYWVLKVAKKHHVPIRIAHSHTAIEPFHKKLFLKNIDFTTTIKDAVQSIVRYFVPKVATHYFACGRKAAIWLFGQKNLGKVLILNNAIDAKKFSYNKKSAKANKTKLKLNGEYVIGHVGSFGEPKNHAFLLEVFHQMLQENNNMVLVLVGDGYLRPKIEQRARDLNISEKVKFMGVQQDIPGLLQAFDLFLFPSLYEGLPVTLIEAQASGLKIFASDSVTEEVVIVNDLVTFLSLKESATSWSKYILENRKYHREETFEKIVEGRYDIQANAKELEELYLNNVTLCAESTDL